eukprot:UN25871
MKSTANMDSAHPDLSMATSDEEYRSDSDANKGFLNNETLGEYEFGLLLNHLGVSVSDRDSRIVFRYLDKKKSKRVRFDAVQKFLKSPCTSTKVETVRKKLKNK